MLPKPHITKCFGVSMNWHFFLACVFKCFQLIWCLPGRPDPSVPLGAPSINPNGSPSFDLFSSTDDQPDAAPPDYNSHSFGTVPSNPPQQHSSTAEQDALPASQESLSRRRTSSSEHFLSYKVFESAFDSSKPEKCVGDRLRALLKPDVEK